MIYEWIAGNLVGKGDVLTIGQAWLRSLHDPDVRKACRGVLRPFKKTIAAEDILIVNKYKEELKQRSLT